MQRLLRKFETAKDLVPRPQAQRAEAHLRYGVIYYGSTSPVAMDEAFGMSPRRARATTSTGCASAPSCSIPAQGRWCEVGIADHRADRRRVVVRRTRRVCAR